MGILAIDIGGSHLKIRASGSDKIRRVASGPKMGPAEMVDAVRDMAGGLDWDRVAMGYPGPVVHGRILAEPHNLAPGWKGRDFGADWGKPTRIVNDALMQAVGSYEGGRMLFLGLGTGLGAAMVVDWVGQPMELAHLNWRKGKTYEDYLGRAALDKHGKKTWRKHVTEAVEDLRAALRPDEVVLGGGNAEHLRELPTGCRLGDNALAFEGGFRLWNEERLRV